MNTGALKAVNEFKIGLIQDFGGNIMSPYYGHGWWRVYAYVGAILGGMTLPFLGLMQYACELQINKLIYIISGGIALASSLLVAIVLNKEWIGHKCKLSNSIVSKIDKLYWWHKPLSGFIGFGLVIFIFRLVSTIICYFIPFSSEVLSGVLGFLLAILLILCGFILPYLFG